MKIRHRESRQKSISPPSLYVRVIPMYAIEENAHEKRRVLKTHPKRVTRPTTAATSCSVQRYSAVLQFIIIPDPVTYYFDYICIAEHVFTNM